MPHDIFGNEIKVGDRVTIEYEVTAVQQGNEYCNLNLTSVEKMFPGDYPSQTTANAKQVKKLLSLQEANAQVKPYTAIAGDGMKL